MSGSGRKRHGNHSHEDHRSRPPPSGSGSGSRFGIENILNPSTPSPPQSVAPSAQPPGSAQPPSASTAPSLSRMDRSAQGYSSQSRIASDSDPSTVITRGVSEMGITQTLGAPRSGDPYYSSRTGVQSSQGQSYSNPQSYSQPQSGHGDNAPSAGQHDLQLPSLRDVLSEQGLSGPVPRQTGYSRSGSGMTAPPFPPSGRDSTSMAPPSAYSSPYGAAGPFNPSAYETEDEIGRVRARADPSRPLHPDSQGTPDVLSQHSSEEGHLGQQHSMQPQASDPGLSATQISDNSNQASIQAFIDHHERLGGLTQGETIPAEVLEIWGSIGAPRVSGYARRDWTGVSKQTKAEVEKWENNLHKKSEYKADSGKRYTPRERPDPFLEKLPMLKLAIDGQNLIELLRLRPKDPKRYQILKDEFKTTKYEDAIRWAAKTRGGAHGKPWKGDQKEYLDMVAAMPEDPNVTRLRELRSTPPGPNPTSSYQPGPNPSSQHVPGPGYTGPYQ